jgi:carbon-monoxide dehydrogenase medium subunit
MGETLKTPRFEYYAPDTVDEALSLLAEHGDEAKVVAGGQSLVPMLAMRLARPEHLIDINRITTLSSMEERDGAIAFGAIVRERAAERSTLVQEKLPLLAEALPLVGHVAIRNRGTIGGTIAHADASGEVPAVALALDGEVLVRSARGERTIPAAEFFQGHFTTAMDDDELLIEVRLPVTPAGAGWAFQEVARRHGDFALVGVGAMVRLDGAGAIAESRICLMGVDSTPVRATAAEAALAGATPSLDTFTAAAKAAIADLEPASDVHGSAEFRSHLAGVTVRRALTTAAERAGAGA